MCPRLLEPHLSIHYIELKGIKVTHSLQLNYINKCESMITLVASEMTANLTLKTQFPFGFLDLDGCFSHSFHTAGGRTSTLG
ncbi:hypothetical protein DEO72_LG1g1070 [Vigna unguiculata]|uniref:Uncharacterized protein n=1 Tax=Vigna unguiculata TaxID=3917 RepID=A0A4D6KHW3_VIGUN|nr:hypothetical protein DEO72_LG1g1070 [Vigna unguiculata]